MKRYLLSSILVLSVCLVTDQQVNSAVLTGTLLGHDGKPMLAAHVHVARLTGSLNPQPLLTVAADSEGRFELTNDSTAQFLIMFTGVHHRPLKAVVLYTVPKVIQVDVRLGTYDYYDHTDWLGVIGDFNEFSGATPVPLNGNPDGTYTCEVEPIDDTLDFQVLGVAKGTIIAGVGDGYSFTYERQYVTGGYRSWIAAGDDGPVMITYDPSVFPPANQSAHMVFADPATDNIAEMYRAMDERQWRFFNARSDFLSRGGNYPDFTMDWSNDLEQLSRLVASETDGKARALASVAYLQLKDLTAPIDSAVARTILEDLPPSSAIWSLRPGAMIGAVETAGGVGAHLDYLERAVETLTDPEVIATVLLALVEDAHQNADEALFNERFGQLTSNYPESWQAKSARSEHASTRTVEVGRPVPAFALLALDDSTNTYTPESFAGTFYLIDIWATWCPHCLEERPGLQEQYERFRDRGLEILSVSLDRTPGTVAQFRAQKYPMPWLHTFSPGGFNSDAARIFEVSGVPKPILVDKNGAIVAMGAELRGEQLAETLERVLSE